jgi:hypothetical protein
MSRNQRLGFLGIAAAIALVAIVIFAVGSGPDETAEDADRQQARQTATPSATAEPGSTATPEPTPTATPRPRPPLLTAGKVTRLRFTEGETVRFRARSEVVEEIHVHGYDRYVDLPAGETVNVAFEADITGIFEVELHGSGEAIAQLRVDPA